MHNRLFYLATPPSVFLPASASIRAAGTSPSGWTRVVVEKPFGRDAESSLALSEGLSKHLAEDQVRACLPAGCGCVRMRACLRLGVAAYVSVILVCVCVLVYGWVWLCT